MESTNPISCHVVLKRSDREVLGRCRFEGAFDGPFSVNCSVVAITSSTSVMVMISVDFSLGSTIIPTSVDDLATLVMLLSRYKEVLKGQTPPIGNADKQAMVYLYRI